MVEILTLGIAAGQCELTQLAKEGIMRVTVRCNEPNGVIMRLSCESFTLSNKILTRVSGAWSKVSEGDSVTCKGVIQSDLNAT